MEYEEDELVLGIVEKIENLNVFVKLPNGDVGTIMSSEIAPGRIKNLREFVAPNKIVVCKILRITNGRIDLSLRRVTAKERQEVLNHHKQEKDIERGMKAILKDSFEKLKEKIDEDFSSLVDFVDEIQTDPNLLKNYFPKEYIPQIEKLTEKKKKQVEIKNIIKLKCFNSNGINQIKNLMSKTSEEFHITYISAGKYLLTIKAEDYKKANSLMKTFSEELEKKSKKISCELSIEEKK